MSRISMMLVLATAFLFSAPARACTVMTMADGDEVVFASNEDGRDPDARLWTVADAEGRFGGLYLGFADGFRQGGMNTRGLCYDITACPRMALEEHGDRSDPEVNLIDEAMATCATVDQVCALFDRHNRRGFERVQVMFADAAGRSVVFDCNHVIRGEGGRQVISNFYLAAPELGRYPCPRHEIAAAMLADAPASVDAARGILSAVRQEGRSRTQYSFIAEPARKRLTVYRFHDFEQPATLPLGELLADGDRELSLDSLFTGRCYALERYRTKREGRLSHVFVRTLDAEGLEAAIAEYQATKINHSEILNELADLGFGLQGDGRLAEAAAAFRLMTEDFPTFARGHEWLGNTLVRLEDYAGARAAYEACLAVDPDNANASDVLAQLLAAG